MLTSVEHDDHPTAHSIYTPKRSCDLSNVTRIVSYGQRITLGADSWVRGIRYPFAIIESSEHGTRRSQLQRAAKTTGSTFSAFSIAAGISLKSDKVHESSFVRESRTIEGERPYGEAGLCR